jgi:murein L,D-transpeptidase YafK
MKLIVALVLLMILTLSFQDPTFRENQLRFVRVRQAYQEYEHRVIKTLADSSISLNTLRIYLRAFKTEAKIELWAKNASDLSFKLIRNFVICQLSGELGPKRRQYDRQVPEGFYQIKSLNPFSKFYLSMEVDYPNESDRMLGHKGNLGGDIYIHGSCATSGCIPINDDQIKELYVYIVEAKNSGQDTIALTIFPAELSIKSYKDLVALYKGDNDKINLWEDLKKGYDLFNNSKIVPKVRFMENGRHEVY